MSSQPMARGPRSLPSVVEYVFDEDTSLIRQQLEQARDAAEQLEQELADRLRKNDLPL